MHFTKKILVLTLSLIFILDFTSCTVVERGNNGYHRKPRRPRPVKTIIVIKEDRRHRHHRHHNRK